MNKSLILSLVALVLSAINISCYAADAQKIGKINLTNSQDAQDANAMESAFSKYLMQKMECVSKKLAPRSTCNRLSEFYNAKEVYQNTVKLHPNWRDNSIHWVYLTQTDHHMEFYSLKRVFE